MTESETPPQASSPLKADDFEVSSQRISIDHPVARGTMKTAPEGDTLTVKGPGGAAPTGASNEGPELSGLQPKMTLVKPMYPYEGNAYSRSSLQESGGAGYSDEHITKCVHLRGTSYLNGYGS